MLNANCEHTQRHFFSRQLNLVWHIVCQRLKHSRLTSIILCVQCTVYSTHAHTVHTIYFVCFNSEVPQHLCSTIISQAIHSFVVLFSSHFIYTCKDISLHAFFKSFSVLLLVLFCFKSVKLMLQKWYIRLLIPVLFLFCFFFTESIEYKLISILDFMLWIFIHQSSVVVVFPHAASPCQFIIRMLKQYLLRSIKRVTRFTRITLCLRKKNENNYPSGETFYEFECPLKMAKRTFPMNWHHFLLNRIIFK